MLAAHRLKQYPNSKILLLGPTRPLIDQYYKVFTRHFEIDEKDMAIFTGFVKPQKRQELWKSTKIIFSTPQGLENDIINNRIALEDVSLLGFDEAHRAVGDYAYAFIAKQYENRAKYPRIVAMTASPGSELEKINEVLQNLFIEEIEIRTDKSQDVAKYVQEVEINWAHVELLEEFKKILKYLDTCFKSKLTDIKNLGYISSIMPYTRSKRDILGLQAQLQGEIAKGNRDFEVLRSISLAAEALKIHHASELLETQGVEPVYNYLTGIENRARTTKVKAVQNLVKDINFRSALIKTNTLMEKQIEHPKFAALSKIIKENVNGKKCIVFTQYRDTGIKIVNELNKLQNAKAILFVGQAKKNGTGLTQKKQIEILNNFRNDEFNILVSSSVGEEGLDIPSVDYVIFYEPIPSAIRQIQRRGRTARQKKGKVIILIAKETRDEAYRWTAHHKEKRMYRTLQNLKSKLVLSRQNERLEKYIPVSDVKIIADVREKGSGVIKELIEHNVKLKLETLPIADYLCSKDCGIEFKTTEDFVDSLIDGRLLAQMRELKKNFIKPLIIVEGTQDIYSIRNIHPNAIRGLLATIAVSYSIPIIFTRNYKDTASMLLIIAKREQEDNKNNFSLHHSKKNQTLKSQQEYMVSSLPLVGPNLAKALLEKFGSVKKIMNASEKELKKIETIGDKKAKQIRDVIDSDYE